MKKEKIKAIIFDIDGVLIDVSQSYRLAIKKTAEFFLGRILDMKDVEMVKNQGINDDIDAAEILIQQNGGDFRKEVITKKFNEYYLGREWDGFVKNEKLALKTANLGKLKKYRLAVFTGRPRDEAMFGLKRFKLEETFDSIIVRQDVKQGKPDPEGINMILEKLGVNKDEVVYVGDNVADIRAAMNAGIGFIGVVPPGADKEYTKKLLKIEGAEIVLDNINDITGVL